MREITIENFIVDEKSPSYMVEKGKVERNYFYTDPLRLEINYSSILTKLIQEGGRWCELYASDLFIMWEYMLKRLKQSQEAKLENYEENLAFGFRQNGVDTIDNIINKINNGYSLYEYRSIYALKVSIFEGNIKMEMDRVYL